jgi:hypothetical protein
MKDDIKRAFKKADTLSDSTMDKCSEKQDIFDDKGDRLVLEKKSKSKNEKKMVPLCFDVEVVKRLDMACKKVGYSRNEMVLRMIEFGLDKLEIKE